MSTSKELKYTDVMKPEDISIALMWTAFAGAVLPPEASQIQRDEMRISFYAGFTECFKVMCDLTDDLTEDHAAATLSRIDAEAREFCEQMIAKLK